MKLKKENYSFLYKAALLVFMTLFPLQACTSCATIPPRLDKKDQDPQANKPPILVGHVTLGKYNQQNHPVAIEKRVVGNGACTCIVGVLLKEMKSNPPLDLHQHPEKIDSVLGEGIQLYTHFFSSDAQQGFATEIEKVLQKIGLQQDETTLDPGFLQPNMLTTQDAIAQQLGKFSNSKKLAVIKVGPEVWALISHGDGRFDLFDPHGRQELNAGNSAAFVKRDNQEGVSTHIWTYYPFSQFTPKQINELEEDTKQNGAVYIYWIE